MAPTQTPIEQHTAPLTERRRRNRLDGQTLGWILPPQPRLAPHLPTEDQGWEVRVFNVSRLGVGFISTDPMLPGTDYRLRIGRGPMTRARLIRIVACRQTDTDLYSIGAEFLDISPRSLPRAA